MRKIVLLSTLTILLTSCFGTACLGPNDHYHHFTKIGNENPDFDLFIMCRPNKKVCFVKNVNENDSIFFSSTVSKNFNSPMKKINRDTVATLKLEITNDLFHKNFLSDTLLITMKSSTNKKLEYLFTAKDY